MDPIRRRDRHGNGATTIIIYNRSGGDLHKRRQVGSIESRLAPIKSFVRLKIEKKNSSCRRVSRKPEAARTRSCTSFFKWKTSRKRGWITATAMREREKETDRDFDRWKLISPSNWNFRNPYCIRKSGKRDNTFNNPKYIFSYVILYNCILLNNFTVDRTIVRSGANCGGRQMDRIAEIQIWRIIRRYTKKGHR